MDRIILGREVICKVTKLKGIAVARTESLNGCFRITVQPPVDEKDGKLPDSYYVDEFQLEYTKNTVQIQGYQNDRGDVNTKAPRL